MLHRSLLPRRILGLLIALGLVLSATLPTVAQERDLAREEKDALAVITARKGKRHVVKLAGVKCEGRASGEKGCDVAADYLAQVFEEMGVVPGGTSGTYFQTFPIRAGPFPGQGRRTGREVRQSTTRNVIGVIHGSDDDLKRELIIVGAHYDHLGFRDLRKRKVYWGACDNAAGTAAVLLVAEAYARAEIKPRRSLMFILFSGEERGLFGSKHYTSSPTWPLKDTVAMINLDMLGRNKPHRLDVYGKGTGKLLDEANERHARAAKFKLEFKGGSVFSRSDHFPFYEKKVSVLFFTCGLYKDYHDLDDEARLLNYGQVERAAEHCWRILRDVGEADERPVFEEVTPTGAAGVFGFVPVVLARSHLQSLKLGRKRGAVAVGEVKPGKAAAEAGVQPDDLVIGLAGKALSDKDPMGELDKIADRLKKGRKYGIHLIRDGKKKTLPIRVP